MQTVQRRQTESDSLTLRLRKASPKVTGGLLRARESAYADGIFPAKTKILTALSVSVAIRCEPCIEMYAGRAVEIGATFEEVVEFLNVAMTMQGCPGEAWALKALGIYERLASGQAEPSKEPGSGACCEDEKPSGTGLRKIS